MKNKSVTIIIELVINVDIPQCFYYYDTLHISWIILLLSSFQSFYLAFIKTATRLSSIMNLTSYAFLASQFNKCIFFFFPFLPHSSDSLEVAASCAWLWQIITEIQSSKVNSKQHFLYYCWFILLSCYECSCVSQFHVFFIIPLFHNSLSPSFTHTGSDDSFSSI